MSKILLYPSLPDPKPRMSFHNCTVCGKKIKSKDFYKRRPEQQVELCHKHLPYIRGSCKWTQQDIDDLKALYQARAAIKTYTKRLLQQHSQTAIYNRASQLHLIKKPFLEAPQVC